ncbi:hypothetical protein OWV82_022072 [Melia azedarach]|uniref:Uncharacterized protein n=1 Tax=Melia azedarach TaxID=155640 RepID=A0ACC1X3K5_MELAZ|nr:hypothetical protein OWV82_022072 [Melia azedarach]
MALSLPRIRPLLSLLHHHSLPPLLSLSRRSSSFFLSLPPPSPVLDTTITNRVFVDFSLCSSSSALTANPSAPNPTPLPPQATSLLAPTTTLSPSLSLTSNHVRFFYNFKNLSTKSSTTSSSSSAIRDFIFYNLVSRFHVELILKLWKDSWFWLVKKGSKRKENENEEILLFSAFDFVEIID